MYNSPIENPSTDIFIKIRKIVRAINLESKTLTKEFGLSIAQLLCLGHLEKSPNYISNHKELMALLSLNSSTITGIVNRLANKGLVTRMAKGGDRRTTNLQLTASGIKLLEGTPNLLHDRLSKRLKALPHAEKMQVCKSLDLILRALDAEHIEAAKLLSIEEPVNPEEQVKTLET